jgi:16S rRNA (cytidine1402-2'-O)-methyltransferase
VVATPIGNLMDMTFRAVDVLRQADLIACEDTRVTGKLLKHFGIKTPMISYNDHNGPKIRPRLISDMQAGKSIAVVSDAGTPLISDPGFKLVSACADEGLKVIPIPGASAFLAGLVVSALPTDRVLFIGFLPSKQKARQDTLEPLVGIDATLVFYESGPRLATTLAALSLQLGERSATVARELTKLYEEVTRGTLSNLSESYEKAEQPKGELVIVVGPPTESDEMSPKDIDEALLEALKTMTVRDASAAVATHTRQAKRSIYARALELKATHSNGH